MYFSGVSLLLDIAGHAGVVEAARREEEERWAAVQDILPLPLPLSFPSLRLRPPPAPGPDAELLELSQPDDDDEQMAEVEGRGCGRAISTYPWRDVGDGTRVRMGDPVCDRFLARFLPGRTIAVVADGCGWGVRPRQAAVDAVRAFVSYLEAHHQRCPSTHDGARLLSRAFAAAQDVIVAGIEDQWEAGTTTLLGGMLVRVDGLRLQPLDAFTGGSRRKASAEAAGWAFLWAGVGDCKAYLYSCRRGSFRDLTAENRFGSKNAQDCGGRLGPATIDKQPDMRNFQVDLVACEEGDLLLLVSDGVHDNLDPRVLGFQPSDLGQEGTWEEMDPAYHAALASTYSTRLLASLARLKDVSTAEGETRDSAEGSDSTDGHLMLPEAPEGWEFSGSVAPGEELKCRPLVERILAHCRSVNKKAIDFMRENPNEELPTNYSLYPGKMDHTTCLCFRVG